mgnify:CR=1 FL=1
MHNYKTDTLVPVEVSKRREEKEELRRTQNKQMGSRQVELQTNNFYRSVDSTNDKYMIDALKKVRKSDVTHPESLTRINGNWLFNR